MGVRLPTRNFAAGELAPWLDGIANEKTAVGCRTLENWIVLKQGSVTRRPGTFFAGEVKDSADNTILVPIEIDTDNIYVAEIGDLYMRFWIQSTHLPAGGLASPYSVVTPWTCGEIDQLRWQYVPNEKAVYWVHPKHAMRKLAFTSAASWTLGVVHIDWSEKTILMGSIGLYASDGFNHPEASRTPLNPSKTYRFEGGIRCYDGSYVATGSGGAASNAFIVASDDGLEWIDVTPSPYDVPAERSIEWVRDSGRVFIGTGSSTLFISADGTTYYPAVSTTTFPTTFSVVKQLTHGWGNNHFILVAGSGGGKSCYTRDVTGLTGWDALTVPTTSSVFKDVAQADEVAEAIGSVWVAVGHSGQGGTSGTIWRCTVADPSGTGWTAISAAGYPQFICCASDLNGHVVAATSGGLYRITCSARTITAVSALDTTIVTDLAWTGGSFIALASDGTIYRSDNGDIGSWVSIRAYDGRHINQIRRMIIGTPGDDDENFEKTTHHPRYVASYNNRLVLAGTDSKPAGIWGSKVGQLNNFFFGAVGDQAWSYELTHDRNVDIRWVVGGNQLVVGTRTCEGIMVGDQAEGVTPSAARFVWISTFGSANVQPVRIHDTIVFVQRGGEIIRGLIPGAGEQAWQSPDLTFAANHIADGGVTHLAHQDDPQTILYAIRGDGTMLSLTYHPPNVVGWSRIVTDGDIESVAVVPTSGAEDEVWVIVNRTIGGATKRYVEYFDTLAVSGVADAHYVDCGRETANSVTFATMGSLTHLAAEVIDVLLDGDTWLSAITVAAAGTIAFPTGYSGTQAHAGLPYTSRGQTMQVDVPTQMGSSAGVNRRVSNLIVWVYDTQRMKFGPSESELEAAVWTSSTALVTESAQINFPGKYDREGYVWFVQSAPLPATIVGFSPEVEVGG